MTLEKVISIQSQLICIRIYLKFWSIKYSKSDYISCVFHLFIVFYSPFVQRKIIFARPLLWIFIVIIVVSNKTFLWPVWKISHGCLAVLCTSMQHKGEKYSTRHNWFNASSLLVRSLPRLFFFDCVCGTGRHSSLYLNFAIAHLIEKEKTRMLTSIVSLSI